MPDHSFMISQFKCTWSKPFELAGIQSKEGSDTQFNSGAVISIMNFVAVGHGVHVVAMEPGSVPTDFVKDGAIQSAEDKWSSVRRTGKFKGIKAKGTCKGKAGADGSTIWDSEGGWQLPRK